MHITFKARVIPPSMAAKNAREAWETERWMLDATVKEVLDHWQRDLAVDRAASTRRRYVGVLHQFLDWYAVQEHRPLTLFQLTPITLVGYRNAL